MRLLLKTPFLQFGRLFIETLLRNEGKIMARSFFQLVEALERLQAETPHRCSWRPPADVYRTSDGWLVKFDLAGVDPHEVQLVVRGSQLTVAGVRRDAMVQEGFASYSLEISYNRFERALELPFDAQDMTIETEYRDGMLLVRFHHAEDKTSPRGEAPHE